MPSSRLPRRLQNDVTGDTIEILNSPLHGDNGALLFKCTLGPHAAGSPLHLHRSIDETFEVVAGVLKMEVGARNNWQALEAGERTDMSSGMAHSFSNPSNEPTVFISSCTPGDGFEKFLRAMYGLANDGRTNQEGMPSELRALALALTYAELIVPGFPRMVQSGLIGGLASLGRMSGVERKLTQYWLSETTLLDGEVA